MLAEGIVKEVTPYDGVLGDIGFQEVGRGDCAWNVLEGGNVEQISTCDLDLAATLIQQSSLLPSDEDTKVLVLNCGAGYAGIAALRLNCQQVVFVDSTDEALMSVWKGVLVNAPDNMASARCFSTNGLHWAALEECSTNPIWERGPYDIVLLAQSEVSASEWHKMYRILERHLTCTGAALVAVRRSGDPAAMGEGDTDKGALFERIKVDSTQSETSSIIRVAKRAIV